MLGFWGFFLFVFLIEGGDTQGLGDSRYMLWAASRTLGTFFFCVKILTSSETVYPWHSFKYRLGSSCLIWALTYCTAVGHYCNIGFSFHAAGFVLYRLIRGTAFYINVECWSKETDTLRNALSSYLAILCPCGNLCYTLTEHSGLGSPCTFAVKII